MASHTSMEGDAAHDLQSERDERFQALIQELLPEVRRRHARYSEERVFETAIHLAAYRMWSGNSGKPGPGGAA